MCTISHGSQVRSLTSDECLTLNEGIELLVIILQVSFNNLNNFVWYTCWVYHNSDGSPSAWATSTTVHCRWASNLNDFAIASHLKTGIIAQTNTWNVTLSTHICIELSMNLSTYFIPVQFLTGSITDSESNGSSGLHVVRLMLEDEHPIWMFLLVLRLAL